MSSSRIPLQRSDQLGGHRGGVKAFGAFARMQQEGSPRATRSTVQKQKRVLLSNVGIVKRKQDAAAAYTLRQNGEFHSTTVLIFSYSPCIVAMSTAELAELAKHAANSAATQQEDIAMEDYNNAFNSNTSVPISHAGGEMDTMAAAIIPRCVVQSQYHISAG